MSPRMIATSERVGRAPTAEERQQRFDALWARFQMESNLAGIQGLEDGEIKARRIAGFEAAKANIEAIAAAPVVEWRTSYREANEEERQQQALDEELAEQEGLAEEQKRQELVELARAAANNVGLSLEEYLSLHPSPALVIKENEDAAGK